jgi:uncharacterized radical SAM superfamily Fe-S cluster-containing enzyme
VFDASFDGGAWNYRAFRNAWTGRPTHPPSIAAARRRGAATVYASFNGSTETAYWRVDAGPTRKALRPVKTVPKAGFETRIRLDGVPLVVTVTALDAKHRALATSKVYRPFV